MTSSPKAPFEQPDFLAKLRARDGKSVAAIVTAYSEQILRASLGAGFEKEQAKELTQRVWATFFEVVEGFEGRSHIRTFIFGIFYNKASEMRREQAKTAQFDDIDRLFDQHFDAKDHWTSSPLDPEEFCLAAETLEIIKKCLDQLPLNQRMAFSLRELDGEESQEICKILSVTITNLGVLLFRAKNSLRECIERKAQGKARPLR